MEVKDNVQDDSLLLRKHLYPLSNRAGPQHTCMLDQRRTGDSCSQHTAFKVEVEKEAGGASVLALLQGERRQARGRGQGTLSFQTLVLAPGCSTTSLWLAVWCAIKVLHPFLSLPQKRKQGEKIVCVQMITYQ